MRSRCGSRLRAPLLTGREPRYRSWRRRRRSGRVLHRPCPTARSAPAAWSAANWAVARPLPTRPRSELAGPAERRIAAAWLVPVRAVPRIGHAQSGLRIGRRPYRAIARQPACRPWTRRPTTRRKGFPRVGPRAGRHPFHTASLLRACREREQQIKLSVVVQNGSGERRSRTREDLEVAPAWLV